jgi:peptidoglycan lytic transglycosylase B
MRIVSLLVLALAFDAAAAQGYAQRSEVREFVAEMAERHGFTRQQLQQVFSAVRRQPAILRAIVAPAESAQRSWQTYRALFLTPQRIEAGLRFEDANAEALARAQAVYGVPEEIIVAIIGVETVYGRNLGGYRVMDALTTLAFDFPQRGEFFRQELEQYLLFAREEGLRLLEPKGSYAGAMGIPQFMPGTYRRFAVDFDGDGRRDLLRSTADAIGSVANFLKEHGWQTGQPVAVRGQLKSSEPPRALVEAGIKPSLACRELEAMGISSEEPLAPDATCALIELATAGQAPEYRVALENFYVLTRYNRSSFYAASVLDLAQALAQAKKKTP